jgi:hypothetical protein
MSIRLMYDCFLQKEHRHGRSLAGWGHGVQRSAFSRFCPSRFPHFSVSPTAPGLDIERTAAGKDDQLGQFFSDRLRDLFLRRLMKNAHFRAKTGEQLFIIFGEETPTSKRERKSGRNRPSSFLLYMIE